MASRGYTWLTGCFHQLPPPYPLPVQPLLDFGSLKSQGTHRATGPPLCCGRLAHWPPGPGGTWGRKVRLGFQLNPVPSEQVLASAPLSKAEAVSRLVSFTLMVENGGTLSSFVAPGEALCLKCQFRAHGPKLVFPSRVLPRWGSLMKKPSKPRHLP